MVVMTGQGLGSVHIPDELVEHLLVAGGKRKAGSSRRKGAAGGGSEESRALKVGW